ncbi:MAG TPA: GvpL/GvpF family gas vesicle protein [Nocardioidaceae bacterium]|nr:GvpL/GvpF family gas vesicle protein [Nocardioidaceae bacterium]
MPLQVFGVVRQGHPLPGSGRDRESVGVRLVESGDLAAAVGEIEEGSELREEDAARHLDILILLLRDGPVLPLAFGTLSPDEDAVRAEVLDPAAADLAQRLAAVDGYVETRLEIFFDEPTALREVMEADPDVRALAAETQGASSLDARIALGEAVSMQLTSWRQQQAEALLETLAPAVEDIVETESSEPLQQRWAFLVRADALERLDDTVGRLRSSLQNAAAVEYVGPLPVYSFLGQVQADTAPPRSNWEAPPTRSGSAWGW